MKTVKVAATQMSCSWSVEENIAKAEKLVRQAADAGAQIILLQELLRRPISARRRNRSTTIWLCRCLKTGRSSIFRP